MTEPHATPVSGWVICHETIYRYSTAVVFAPHVLRLSPRSDSVRTLSRRLQITPFPVEVIDYTDDIGNTCTRVSFDSTSGDELQIKSRVEVQTYAHSHEQLLSRHWLPPLPWTPPDNDSLVTFRRPDDSAEVTTLAQRLATEVNGAPLSFFQHLNTTLHAMIDRQIRVEGAAQTPGQTLALGRGACRDLTVLYLAVCRALGVAGRFVSGYQGQEASPDHKRHLHAWPEVFIPEHGWLGWDPMHGVPAGPGHVALAAAPEQARTMPIDGGFYFNGPTVTSTLDYSITFEAL